MAVIREITVEWNSIGSPGGTSVMHFDAATLLANQRQAIKDFVVAIATRLATSTSATVATNGREFDPATGTLTGDWSTTVAQTAAGSVAGSPVSNAAQGLVRLNTGVVVNGRFLRGKLFIPGMASNTISNGEVSAVAVTGIASAAQTMAIAAGLLVWHRPNTGGPGSASAVINTSVWNEFAVLRRRR